MIFTLREGEHVVKKSRFTEEQIAFALKQAELGTKVDEICRTIGISDATFYKWRQKYGGLGPSELRRLRQLEEENSKLKRLWASPSFPDTFNDMMCSGERDDEDEKELHGRIQT